MVPLGANVLCGSEPEGHVTVTTIYADTDFLLDQLFWQHADVLRDRLDAQGFADTIYTEPAQVLRLGEDRAGMLMPWLDELVALSVDGVYRERFHRVQALWHAVIDQISPFIRITPYRTSPSRHEVPETPEPRITRRGSRQAHAVGAGAERRGRRSGVQGPAPGAGVRGRRQSPRVPIGFPSGEAKTVDRSGYGP